MTVILVLVTFLTFIVLDYFLNRKKALSMVPTSERMMAPALVGGDYVSGFHTPPQVSYHPGHTWLVQERKSVVRMGADEFAAALAGRVVRPSPQLGARVRILGLLEARLTDSDFVVLGGLV